MDDTDTSTEQKIIPIISPIATPMANEKLSGRTLKLVRKACKARKACRGVKEVIRAIRKKQKGILVLAGNTTPIDVICHLPILCEELGMPYIFVPAKEELGAASATKRPTSVVLILPNEGDKDYTKAFDKVHSAVTKLQVAE